MASKVDYANYDSVNERNNTFNSYLDQNNSVLSGQTKPESNPPFSMYNVLN